MTSPRTLWPAPHAIGLAESARIACDALLGNKLRTALTALGVVIGVASVVALLALGRGAQADIADRITANGANLLTVRAGSLGQGGFGSGGGKAQSLSNADAAALADPLNVPAAALVSPEYMGFGSVAAGRRGTSAMVIGATPAYLAAHNERVAAGAFVTERDNRSAAGVAVLGARVATTLFGAQSPLGQRIRVEGQRLTVVGVLAPKGGSSFGSSNDSIIVPLATAQRRLFGARNAGSGKPALSSIAVQARGPAQIAAALAQINATLRRQHRLPPDGSGDDFTLDNQQDLIATLSASSRTLTLYLGAIAAISLLVGGIGIMNVMLMAVRERTREIGLRKAVGARPRDIGAQFLIEALLVSGGGGLLGLLLGCAVALGASWSGQARASLHADAAALALGCALAIGLFFGIAPARRAARLDPIAALRTE